MLPLANRLKKKKDFQEVFKRGRSIKNNLFVFKFMSAITPETRFGIVISKSVSKKAVVRNKIRRRVSEAIKGNLDKIKGNKDIVIVCLPGIKSKEFKDIEMSVEDVIKKIK